MDSMNYQEWFAIAAGAIGGAMALGGLYALAARKGARTGKPAALIFVSCLAMLSLVHGLGLCCVTAVVWAGASLFFGPLPEADCRFMGMLIVVGIVFAALGGLGLATPRLTASSKPTL